MIFLNQHPTPRTLWRFAGGNLAGARRGSVRTHALGCDRCRRELNRVIFARRSLGAPDAIAQPSAAELRAWRREAIATPRPHRAASWAGFSSAAMALGVLAFVLWPSADDRLVSRSDESQAPVHLRVLCISEGVAPLVVDPIEQSCEIGSFVKFVISAGVSKLEHYALFRVQGDALERLYGDAETMPASVPAAETTLPGSYSLRRTGPAGFVLVLLPPNAAPHDPALLSWVRNASDGIHTTPYEAVVVSITVGETP